MDKTDQQILSIFKYGGLTYQIEDMRNVNQNKRRRNVYYIFSDDMEYQNKLKTIQNNNNPKIKVEIVNPYNNYFKIKVTRSTIITVIQFLQDNNLDLDKLKIITGHRMKKKKGESLFPPIENIIQNTKQEMPQIFQNNFFNPNYNQAPAFSSVNANINDNNQVGFPPNQPNQQENKFPFGQQEFQVIQQQQQQQNPQNENNQTERKLLQGQICKLRIKQTNLEYKQKLNSIQEKYQQEVRELNQIRKNKIHQETQQIGNLMQELGQIKQELVEQQRQNDNFQGDQLFLRYNPKLEEEQKDDKNQTIKDVINVDGDDEEQESIKETNQQNDEQQKQNDQNNHSKCHRKSEQKIFKLSEMDQQQSQKQKQDFQQKLEEQQNQQLEFNDHESSKSPEFIPNNASSNNSEFL